MRLSPTPARLPNTPGPTNTRALNTPWLPNTARPANIPKPANPTSHSSPIKPSEARGRARDRGSMSVELVVIAPALVLLLLLIGAGGRWVESHGALDGAARDAARAASVGRTPGDADSLAGQAADSDLAASGWCDGGTVQVGVTGFPDAVAIAQGTSVTVTVTCSVNMSPFTLLGFRAASPVTATAVAPLDPFMCRGANCQ